MAYVIVSVSAQGCTTPDSTRYRYKMRNTVFFKNTLLVIGYNSSAFNMNGISKRNAKILRKKLLSSAQTKSAIKIEIYGELCTLKLDERFSVRVMVNKSNFESAWKKLKFMINPRKKILLT
jgi:hypothetical protein